MAQSNLLLKLKDPNIRARVLMVITALVVVWYGYTTFEYDVQKKKIKKLDTRLLELDTDIGALRLALVSPEKIEETRLAIEESSEELFKLRGEIQQIKSLMQEKYVDILNQLKKEAELHGAELRSFKSFENDVERGDLKMKEINVIMSIQGNYDSLIRFIEKLEEIPAILSLKSLKLQRDENTLPRIGTQLTITLFVLK